VMAISRKPLQKKITKPFQALNGLKCSTVDNFGSYWAFIIILLGFTHFLGDKVKNDQNFRT